MRERERERERDGEGEREREREGGREREREREGETREVPLFLPCATHNILTFLHLLVLVYQIFAAE